MNTNHILIPVNVSNNRWHVGNTWVTFSATRMRSYNVGGARFRASWRVKKRMRALVKAKTSPKWLLGVHIEKYWYYYNNNNNEALESLFKEINKSITTMTITNFNISIIDSIRSSEINQWPFDWFRVIFGKIRI